MGPAKSFSTLEGVTKAFYTDDVNRAYFQLPYPAMYPLACAIA